MTKKVWISNLLKPGYIIARDITDNDKVFVFSGDKIIHVEVVNMEGCDRDHIYISRKDADKLGLNEDGETITIKPVIRDPIEEKSRCIGTFDIPMEKFKEPMGANLDDEGFIKIKLFV